MRTKIYLGLVAVTLFTAALIVPEKVFALTTPAGFSVETYASGLNQPTSFAFVPLPTSLTTTVAAAGDIAQSGGRQADTASLVQILNPGRVLLLGDNAYANGTLAEYNALYQPTWGVFKAKTMPSPGNHEYNTPGAAGYYDYFGTAAGPNRRGYYSFDQGSWHVVSLNSEVLTQAQLDWLEADLRATNKNCILAYWHKPRYSSGQHGNNAAMQPFWDTLYRHGADLVLNGHEHNYERFAKQNPSGQADPGGMRQIIVGTGGAALRAMKTQQPNSESFNGTTHGVLLLSLKHNSYDAEFKPISGGTYTDAVRNVECNGTPRIGAGSHIFIAEKGGKVRQVKNGVLQPAPVYTVPRVNDYGDHGLLGIAVDPQFSTNGHLYLSYTYENTPGTNYTGPKTGQIIRVTVTGDTVSDTSKVVLVGKVTGDATRPSCENFAVTADCIPSDAITHSVGGLRFGPDGKLYASLGDGAGFDSADPRAMRALNHDSLGGKLLRINKDGTAPTDNPFYNGDVNANRSKVWALGLRNAFRFNFRPSGALYLGDVGWYKWEELNVVTRGANMGWPCREGREQVPEYGCTTTNYTDPIHVYDHSPGSGAIAGGTFASAASYPFEYRGSFYMADFAQDWIKKVNVSSTNQITSVDNFITAADGPVDIQTGPDGKIHYLSIMKGELRKVNYAPASATTPPPPPPPPPATTTTPAVPRHIQTVVSPTPTYIGSESRLTTTIRNDGGTGPFTIKMYVFDKNQTEIAYKYFERQTIPTGQTSNFDMTWLPGTLGDYTIKVGLFTPEWSLLEWTDRALTVSVVERAPTTTPPTMEPVAPVHVSTSVSPSSGVTGVERIVTTSIKNNGGTGNVLVDLEVYRGATKVGQKFFDNESIAAGQTKTYTMSVVPDTAGDYKVSVGLFRPGWGTIYSWTDTALTFTVGSGTGTTTPPPPPPPPPPPSGNVIYQDALSAGWTNWSWDTTTDFSSTKFVLEGSKAIEVDYSSPWAGFFLHHDGFNTTGKTNLKIALNGGSPIGEQALQIIPYDSTGKAMTPIRVDTYKGGTKLNTNTWSDITVPLADLGIQNMTITGFVIQGRDGQIQEPYYVDHVRIE